MPALAHHGVFLYRDVISFAAGRVLADLRINIKWILSLSLYLSPPLYACDPLKQWKNNERWAI